MRVVALHGFGVVIPHSTPVLARNEKCPDTHDFELVGALHRLVAAKHRVGESAINNGLQFAASHAIGEVLQQILLAMPNIIQVQNVSRPRADLVGAFDIL